MNINIETPSALRRKVTIELEPAEINRELDRAYNELKRSVQLKGFRPGHAPRSLLERFFGDQIRGDVIQKLVKEYTEKALEENDLTPIVEPEIIAEETDLKNAQLKFSATFDLKPQFEVKDYQDLKIPGTKIEISDDDVGAALERLRERHASLKKVEGGAAVRQGDFAVTTLEGFEDGKPISGTKIEDRMLRVAKDTLAHGLDELLEGAEPGKEVRKTRSYPADYSEKEIAGKNVEWRATVKDVYERIIPALDDEFAKDQGEYQNLDELRAAIRRDLERQAEQEADQRVRQGLIDLIAERNPLELPESLVTRELRAMESEAVATLEAAGIDRDSALQRVQQDAEAMKTRAEKRARSALIVDAIADQEKVEVTDDEVADRIAALVQQSSGRNRERMAEFYGREENRAALKQVMRREKTLDLLLSRAQVEEQPTGASEASGPPEAASSET